MPNCKNYAENILYMVDKLNEVDYRPDSRLVRILDKILIILAGKYLNFKFKSMEVLAQQL
jgi:citrate synthase